MDLQKIGACLRDLRKEKGLTQEQLAEQMNVSQRTVSRWETGANMPDMDVLVQIADFYEVDLRALLKGEAVRQKMNAEMTEVIQELSAYSNMKNNRIKYAVSILLHIILNVMLQSILWSWIIWYYDTSIATVVVNSIVAISIIGLDFVVVYILMRKNRWRTKNRILCHLPDLALIIPALIVIAKDCLRYFQGSKPSYSLAFVYTVTLAIEVILAVERVFLIAKRKPETNDRLD